MPSRPSPTQPPRTTPSPTGGTFDEDAVWDALDASLGEVSFPASRTDLLAQVGAEQITLQGEPIDLRYLVQRVKRDQFASRVELVREILDLPEVQGGR